MLEKLTQKICEAVGSERLLDLAVLCRGVVRERLSSVYDRLGAMMPERALLLVLLEDPAVTTVCEKFGKYLTGNVFNAKQQEFVKVVISYVRENGEITRDDRVNAFPFNLMHPVQLFGEKMPLLQRIVSTLEQLLPTAA